jgi:hypothetical protein
MVRAYILTERERELLNRYVQNNEKLNGFSVLIHYLKKTEKPLIEDAELVKKALEKVRKEES